VYVGSYIRLALRKTPNMVVSLINDNGVPVGYVLYAPVCTLNIAFIRVFEIGWCYSNSCMCANA